MAFKILYKQRQELKQLRTNPNPMFKAEPTEVSTMSAWTKMTSYPHLKVHGHCVTGGYVSLEICNKRFVRWAYGLKLFVALWVCCTNYKGIARASCIWSAHQRV